MNQLLSSRWTKVAAFLVCLLPVAALGLSGFRQELGANPIEFITHATGDWALRFILIKLAVTPARNLLQLAQLIRFRRMFGLFAFFYGCLHFLTYLWLDKSFDRRDMLEDIVKRPFITVGFGALVLMLPLALTSTAGWVRRLGGRSWQLLHRLIYLTALGGVIHYYWLVKSDIRLPVLYGAIVVVLLAYRPFGTWKRRSNMDLRMKLVRLHRQTDDTVSLVFQLTGGKLSHTAPGQFLTFDWIVDGRKLPRSYSISSSPLWADYVEITAKEKGIVSSFLNRKATVGLAGNRAPGHVEIVHNSLGPATRLLSGAKMSG